jgi:hypothetical protein
MRIRATVGVLGFIVLASGCTPMPTVALDATPADLEILTGEWAGEYESVVLGRRGTIEFKLKAGTGEAHGDVLMIPSGQRTPYQSQPYHDAQNAPRTPAFELLTIKFIRATNGSIAGMLDRYWDPDRNCFANTTFNGRVALEVVEGTFKTTFECGTGAATGTWTASKKRVTPNEAWR